MTLAQQFAQWIREDRGSDEAERQTPNELAEELVRLTQMRRDTAAIVKGQKEQEVGIA